MKVKIVFLCLFMTVAFTNSAHSLSYIVGNRYDANKTLSNTVDDPLCAAAAASNVLMYAGWNAGFSNSQDIFLGLQNRWASSTIPLSVKNTWSLWLNGTYTVGSSSTINVDPSGLGNFYPSSPFATYYHTETVKSQALSTADNFLHNGYGVALTIQVNGKIMQHTVTLWGFEKDTLGNYLGIYITDSDDDSYSNNPQPTTDYYKVTFSNQRWNIQNYSLPQAQWWGTDFYINSLWALERNPNAVPEPSTMLLLASGLIGLAGYGRKKFFKK